MNVITGWVRHNFWYKIAAIVLALMLWAYVVSSQPVGEETIRVPVTSKNLPPGLQVVTFEPRDIPVTVSARKNLLSAILRRDFQIRFVADLSRVEVGRSRKVHVELVGLPRGATSTTMEPPYADFVVDRTVTRTWAIDAVRQGYPASGFTVERIVLDPPTAELRTVTSVLGRIDRVVALVDVSERNQSFHDRVPLQAWDNKDLPVSGVAISPSGVDAAVSLRRVEQKAVVVDPQFAPAPAGFRVTRVTCTPQTVVISGEGEALADVTSVPTGAISVPRAAGTVTQIVPLRPPQGVQLAGPNTVSVTATVAPLPTALTKPPVEGAEPKPPAPPGNAPAPETDHGGTPEPNPPDHSPGHDDDRDGRVGTPAGPRTTAPTR
jgi:YbbR domain-containing protein